MKVHFARLFVCGYIKKAPHGQDFKKGLQILGKSGQRDERCYQEQQAGSAGDAGASAVAVVALTAGKFCSKVLDNLSSDVSAEICRGAALNGHHLAL